MKPLALAFAAFLLAALLAAVGYVLLRPRWRWEPEPSVPDECCEWACYEDPGCACSGCKPSANPRLRMTNLAVRNSPSWTSRDSDAGWREAGWE